MPEQDWSAAAREAADYHAAKVRAAKDGEAQAGRRAIAQFVAAAREAGIPEHELTLRPYSGRGRYRTGVRGWFLLPDRSVGVDADANFYVLSGPASLAARLRGVTLTPTPAPARVGERDGESMALTDLLRKRFTAGAEHA